MGAASEPQWTDQLTVGQNLLHIDHRPDTSAVGLTLRHSRGQHGRGACPLEINRDTANPHAEKPTSGWGKKAQGLWELVVGGGTCPWRELEGGLPGGGREAGGRGGGGGPGRGHSLGKVLGPGRDGGLVSELLEWEGSGVGGGLGGAKAQAGVRGGQACPEGRGGPGSPETRRDRIQCTRPTVHRGSPLLPLPSSVSPLPPLFQCLSILLSLSFSLCLSISFSLCVWQPRSPLPPIW